MAQLVVYPDAHTESTSVDGHCDYSTGDTTTWASIHDKTTGSSAGDSDAHAISVMIRRDGSSNWVDTRRMFILFDTSALPDDCTITSATCSIVCNNVAFNNFSDSICLVGSNPASNTAISTADFDAYSTTHLATDILISSFTAEDTATFTLNAAGLAAISKTGITKFAVMSKFDVDNTAPGGSGDGRTQVDFYFADNGSKKPTLTIDYTVPVTTPSGHFHFM